MSTVAVEPLPDRLLSRQDLARLFGVHPITIDAWTREGRIPAPIRVGFKPRWHPALIAKLLNPATEG